MWTAQWNVPGYCRPGIAAEYHQTTWCAEEAIDFMLEERDGPWLMSVNPFDPHPALDPPLSYLERMDVDAMPLPLFREEELESQLRFDGIDHQTETPISPHDYDARRMVAAYYAQIELIDDQVGRMLDALEQSGQRENTHRHLHQRPRRDAGRSRSAVEGLPLLRRRGARAADPLVAGPHPGGRRQRRAGRADRHRADAAGGVGDARLAAHPGHSRCWPLLTGQVAPDHHRDFVRCEYHDALDHRYASHANMLRNDRYKLVVYHGHEVGELYDLQEDPEEYVNLWDDAAMQDVKYALMKQLFDAVMLAVDEGIERVGRY